uniref:Cellular tumor antigen p53 n=1 Tax=Eptatretus burgeri TaxID=7764 RepID=A0A8C4RD55_EPTBU
MYTHTTASCPFICTCICPCSSYIILIYQQVQDASLCNNLICQSTSTTPPVTPPPIKSNCYGVFLPADIDHPGAYKFSLSFPNSSSSKAAPWTFSPMLKKLYCQLGKPCPLQISVTAKPPPNYYIRAMAIFKQKDHVLVPVTRCPTHYQNHQDACYLLMIMWFGYTISLFQGTSVGCEYTPLMCSFMCNTSCNGGMNRRPILLVLTLETSNWEVIARRCIEVRICASPGRDRAIDEARFRSVHPEGTEANVKNGKSVAQRKRKTKKRGLEKTSECQEFAKVGHKMRINEGDLMQNRREGKNPTFSPLHDIVEPVLNGKFYSPLFYM